MPGIGRPADEPPQYNGRGMSGGSIETIVRARAVMPVSTVSSSELRGALAVAFSIER